MLEANFDAMLENHAIVLASLHEEKDKILLEKNGNEIMEYSC